MSDLVGNPKDRFSHNEAHFTLRGTMYDGLVVSCYVFLKLLIFAFAMCDLVHYVGAMTHLH